ncbi:disease resistance protein ADR2-like [Rosa chinensis]|uniref:disease resistance protein ADR2-like n=1 Tax=Rosa chinensis TaxID=74649 RepID=UPI000D086AA1|nr:disease resistance protein ADR2-like [Rosa chinensis]
MSLHLPACLVRDGGYGRQAHALALKMSLDACVYVATARITMYSKVCDHGDDESLERGSIIGPSLSTAIEDSRSALVVFSENFASSSWCLDELSKILQCREERGQIIYPIFYQVDPSDVRKRRGSFQLHTVEVREHEEVYGNKDKLKEWTDGLREVSRIAGWDSSTYE